MSSKPCCETPQCAGKANSYAGMESPEGREEGNFCQSPPSSGKTPADIESARAYFPRGLTQPEGFRFSTDSLLLAAFAHEPGVRRMADMGTGCGVTALALALRFPEARGVGIDKDAACIAAARENARHLGCERQIAFEQGNLADTPFLARFQCGAYDLVSANPPWRLPGSGRIARATARQNAFTSPAEELAVFTRAAADFLRRHGRFICVFLPARLRDLFAALRSANLEPRRLRAVYPRPGRPAVRVLVEARKDTRPDLVMEPPLVLYTDSLPANRKSYI